jgi:hypothetical protein
MRQPIALRPDYDATRLRRIARESEDGLGSAALGAGGDL